jgi:hypothetical protein
MMARRAQRLPAESRHAKDRWISRHRRRERTTAARKAEVNSSVPNLKFRIARDRTESGLDTSGSGALLPAYNNYRRGSQLHISCGGRSGYRNVGRFIKKRIPTKEYMRGGQCGTVPPLSFGGKT